MNDAQDGHGSGEPRGSSSEVSENPPSEDALARRAALKAALGGTVGAAVWMAPRVEGLSLAPDYAAAASCVGGSASQLSKNSIDCSYYGEQECWGNGCCETYNFSQQSIGSKPFILNASLSGNVNNDGTASVTINNIDPPFQRCNVNVVGNCNNGGSFRVGPPGGPYSNGNNASRNFTVNSNGTTNTLIDCQGGGGYYQPDPNGTIRINVSCECL